MKEFNTGCANSSPTCLQNGPMPLEFVKAESVQPPKPRAPYCVLVVDDEQSNRMLLRDLLEARGYETREAENGRQALQCVVEHPPDLILLDIMMPVMDGFEVCRRLKRNSQTAPIPILMITALSERQERLIGIQAGANDFLNKPIDLQDLMLRVGNALYSKSLYDQLKAEQQKSEQLVEELARAAGPADREL
jgi:CheY-like chemotaxis protein